MAPRFTISLLAICTVGSAVEFCWAAGEAVLVPYLNRHEVKRWMASTIYLANPTIGLCVQPRLGAWSDRLNRRVPFVVGLSLIALLGVVVLMAAAPSTRALGFSEHDEDDDGGNASEIHNSIAMPPVAIATAFVGFGLADVCFDCLLIPGRALLHDTSAAADSSRGDELFTGFQMLGRLLALVISSRTGNGLWGLYEDSVDAHFYACLTVSAAFLSASMMAVLIFVNDRGSTLDIQSDSKSEPTATSDFEMQSMEVVVGSGDCQSSSQLADARYTEMQSTDAVNDSSQSEVIISRKSATTPQHETRRVGLAATLLCVVQALGWVGVCAQSFFWTSWRGEEVGSVDLAVQSVIGVATSLLLPRVNEYLGAGFVWCGSELLFHLLMISVGFMSGSDRSIFAPRGAAPRIVGALSGINYAIHATNAFIVATDVISDPSRRARTVAMVNNALPMGQLFTAVTGGALAQCLGGFEYVFVCYGILGATATSAVWTYSSYHKLFSNTSDWDG